MLFNVILLNFKHVNSILSKPERVCLKKIGPLEDSLMRSPIIGINHVIIKIITINENKISKSRLIILFSSYCKGSSLSVITGKPPKISILIFLCLNELKSGTIRNLIILLSQNSIILRKDISSSIDSE